MPKKEEKTVKAELAKRSADGRVDDHQNSNLRMVFDKINGDNYVYPTKGAKDKSLPTFEDKKFSTTSYNGGASRKADGAQHQHHLSQAGGIEKVKLRSPYLLNSELPRTNRNQYSGVSQLLSEALKNQHKSNKYRFKSPISQEEAEFSIYSNQRSPNNNGHTGFYNTTQNFMPTITPSKPELMNSLTPKDVGPSTPHGQDTASASQTPMLSMNLQAVGAKSSSNQFAVA